MDSQKKDESRDHRREEALARRMGDALDRLAQGKTGECPDAELIAAYHENSLAPDEIGRLEGHFAICGRCRKILAVLAAAVEAPLAEKEVARLGELVAGTRTMERPRVNRSPRRTRWLAPAIGIAAVLAVWFAMRPPWRTLDQNPAGTLVAQAPKGESQQEVEIRRSEQFSRDTPKKKPETGPEALKDGAGAEPQSLNAPADALAKNRPDVGRSAGVLAPNSGVAENTVRDEKKENAESHGTSAPPPPQVAPQSPKSAAALPRQTQVQAAQETPQIKVPSAAANQSDVVTESAPAASPVESAAGSAVGKAPGRDRALGAASAADNKATVSSNSDLPLNGRDFSALSDLKAGAENTTLLKSPSGPVLWRVGRGGNIQRSSDAGRTWILQKSPLQEDWLAGAAISNTVCWIVGRNGAIARTADGKRWEKIAPPPLAADSSGKSPDWIGIVATSAQTATITAGDQRRYVTHDGGKTWREQQ
jgi:hypothetical protein